MSETARFRERLGQARLVHIDAPVFAHHLLAAEPYLELTRHLFGSLRAGEVAGQASAIALFQLLTEVHRRGDRGRAEEVARRLGVLRGLEWVAVGPEIAARAAEVRARLGGRPERAVQIATGLAAGADVFLTEGSGLRRIADMRVVNLGDYVG